MVRGIVPADRTVKRIVETSTSLEHAAARLGLSKSCVTRHARRLGVRSTFRYGVERLPPDEVLVSMLRDTRGIGPLADRLGVTRMLLTEKAEQLGIDARFKDRAGLPDDVTLWQALLWCDRFSDVAREYGVPEHHIRNQARRLGVPSPARRGKKTKAAVSNRRGRS
jgi:hypothetical protein